MPTIELTGGPTGIGLWKGIYRNPADIKLSCEAQTKIQDAHNSLKRIIAKGGPLYGVNTGSGRLAGKVIPDDDIQALQRNLVLSHSIGSGSPLSEPETRLVMALKINGFAQGCSGVRPRLVETMVEMFNKDILPVIPSQGSVGASGDLTPHAHLAAAMMGEGQVSVDGEYLAAASALRDAGIEPLSLQPKEGMALLNGTQVSTALALAALFEAEQALESAVLIGAMTTEAVLGSARPFDERIHLARRQFGQIEIARRLSELIDGSEFREKALTEGRVQDPYCIRCQPQVYGACLDLLESSQNTLQREADAVTDNPLIFSDTDEILSGGNFHAEPVAFAADTIAMAVCEIGSLSERRLAMLIDESLSGLPPFLTDDPGVNSGFMSGQIGAAAMVAENRQKAFPASVDSIPTVANYEDHVSMATHGARRLSGMIETLNNILATELLAAVEGCDHRGLRLGKTLLELFQMVRSEVPRMNHDRAFGEAYQAARNMLKSGRVAELRH